MFFMILRVIMRVIVLFIVLLIPREETHANHRKLAVVLIDMQTEFLENAPPHQLEALVERQILLLEWAKKEGIPVLVIEFDLHDYTISELRNVVKSMEPDRYQIVMRGTEDGFEGPFKGIGDADPEDILRGWGVNTLIFAGVNGSACVRETAESALGKGFFVEVASDIIATIFRRAPSAEYPYQFTTWRNCFPGFIEKGQLQLFSKVECLMALKGR